jgi:hypothetical protein
MSEEQRLMAVTLLANAIRKQERDRPAGPANPSESDLVRQAGSRNRATAAHQYVRGMVDLLAVLFEGGRPVAESCYAEARRLAAGTQPPGADRADLN